MENETSEIPIVLWHGGCTDGFAALWAVYRALGEVEAVKGYYQSDDDTIARLTELITDRVVYIVDLSYPVDVIQRWRAHAKHVTLLDHHKTALEHLSPLLSATDPIDQSKVRRSVVTEDDLTMVIDMDRSGAGLAWDHFFGKPGDNPFVMVDYVEPRPWLIDYVEDRDLWKFNLPDSRVINCFIKHQEQTFERWDCMADALTLDDAVLSGVAAKTVVDHFIEGAVNAARIVNLNGHLVPAYNGFYWNTSEACERLAQTPMCLVEGITVREAMELHEKFSVQSGNTYEARRSNVLVTRDTMVDHPPFAFGWHVRSDGKTSYSLRSRAPGGGEVFDVSALAQIYEGGGHKQSAGFASNRPVHDVDPRGPAWV
jgi:hypothetical protein